VEEYDSFMSKGDWRRPADTKLTQEEFDARWDATFGKKEAPKILPQGNWTKSQVQSVLENTTGAKFSDYDAEELSQ
jgi:hypothetical protein